MLKLPTKIVGLIMMAIVLSCNSSVKQQKKVNSMKASQILGNSNYLAISYGGYRTNSRDVQPTIRELKRRYVNLRSCWNKNSKNVQFTVCKSFQCSNRLLTN